jgi:hypothetical protein
MHQMRLEPRLILLSTSLHLHLEAPYEKYICLFSPKFAYWTFKML